MSEHHCPSGPFGAWTRGLGRGEHQPWCPQNPERSAITEADRIDWLERNMPLTLLKVGGIVTAGEQPNEGPDLRSAIDAGIKAEPQNAVKKDRAEECEGGNQ